MKEYTGCNNCKYDSKESNEFPCVECSHNRAVDYYEPKTNADRIRNMTDEELAEFLEKTVYYCRGRQNDKYCEDCPLFECRVCNGEYIGKWLQAEVEEGD